LPTSSTSLVGAIHELPLPGMSRISLVFLCPQLIHPALQRIESLRILVSKEVRALDLSDDRLESVVFNLSKDESWNSFEQDISQRQLQVYDLKTEKVRLDSTSVSAFRQENKEGLFQYGHSKDHRPDLPQQK
jgi:transposase